MDLESMELSFCQEEVIFSELSQGPDTGMVTLVNKT